MDISRRDFLRMVSITLGSLVLRSFKQSLLGVDFPNFDRLGRVAVGKVEVKARPDQNSQTVGVLYEDAVIPWLREVVGPKPYYINQRWIETPDGFVYSPDVQPVRNLPNQPVQELRQTSLGQGMWVEVTIPFVDIQLDREPSSHSWIKAKVEQGLPVRLYYGQVFWVDAIKTDDQGLVFYRVNPNYYGGVDMLWATAQAFRPITNDELVPINPETEDKRIVVDVIRQSLSCFEGDVEVFYCRVSTGAKFDMYGNPVDKWSTPVGKHRVSRKYISLQMSGGTTGAGYDLPGIGWTTIFATGGVAIHATYWHNDYGVPRSHGCVNARPEDAKWVFRWTTPNVNYDPGTEDVALSGMSSTPVEVIES